MVEAGYGQGRRTRQPGADLCALMVKKALTREERLAAALRANLRKRKGGERALTQPEAASDPVHPKQTD